jgi:hypothetical protein
MSMKFDRNRSERERQRLDKKYRKSISKIRRHVNPACMCLGFLALVCIWKVWRMIAPHHHSHPLCRFSHQALSDMVIAHRAKSLGLRGVRRQILHLLENGVHRFDVDVSTQESADSKGLTGRFQFLVAHPSEVSSVVDVGPGHPGIDYDNLEDYWTLKNFDRFVHESAKAAGAVPFVTIEPKLFDRPNPRTSGVSERFRALMTLLGDQDYGESKLCPLHCAVIVRTRAELSYVLTATPLTAGRWRWLFFVPISLLLSHTCCTQPLAY